MIIIHASYRLDVKGVTWKHPDLQVESLQEERDCLLEVTDDRTPNKQKACTPQTGSQGLTSSTSDDYTPQKSMRTAYTDSRASLWKTAVKGDQVFNGSTPMFSQVERHC